MLLYKMKIVLIFEKVSQSCLKKMERNNKMSNNKKYFGHFWVILWKVKPLVVRNAQTPKASTPTGSKKFIFHARALIFYSSNLSLMLISNYVVRRTKETGNIYLPWNCVFLGIKASIRWSKYTTANSCWWIFL